MEQAAVEAMAAKAINLNHLNPDKDKPRGDSLVRMRVVNRNTQALGLLENTISPGEHEIVVYKRDVPKIVERVETEPHKLAIAVETHERDMAELVISKMDRWEGTVDDMLPVIRARSNKNVNEIYDRLRQTSPKSVEGAFQKLTKRALKPLVSAEVISGSEHAEPQRTSLDRETAKLAEAIGIALEKRGGAGPSAADINAMVEAKVRELLGEKAAAPKR